MISEEMKSVEQKKKKGCLGGFTICQIWLAIYCQIISASNYMVLSNYPYLIITLCNKMFTFSCSRIESVILLLLMPKLKEKDLFFSSFWITESLVKTWCKAIFRDWYMNVIYVTVANLKKKKLLSSKHFCSFLDIYWPNE